jgi:NDP-sugar pyrophosphorylase family protein
MNKSQVVILAGGRGKRLDSITEKIPKPMVDVNNSPFLEILIKMLHRQGFSKFLILTGYLSNKIMEYFADGTKLGVSINYSTEIEFLGTAGGLKNAEKFLENEFLLINGDTFLEIDYDKYIKYSQKHSKLCSMICYNGKLYDGINYNLKLDKNYVLNYSKSLSDREFNAVDAGVYFMKKDIITKINKNIASLEEDVFPLLITEKQISGYISTEKFYDIGTVNKLNIFEKFISSKKAYNVSS